MIVALILTLLLAPAAPKPPCVAWRDPATGKILDARGLQERRDSASVRRQMQGELESGAGPIQEFRAPPPCVRRAGEQSPATGPTESPSVADKRPVR